MKSFSKLAALLGLAAVFAVGAVNPTPAVADTKTKHKIVKVKAYTKHLKNGKVVHVKSYVKKVKVKTMGKPKTMMPMAPKPTM